MSDTTTKNNVYLFYGEDDFSLRRKIDQWKTEFAKKYSAQAVVFFDATELGEIETIKKLETELAPSLFASKKLLIVRDALPKKADQEKLAEFLLKITTTAPADYFILFWQTSKPDGRMKFTKEFKSLVKVQEFELPHGMALNAWITAMAKNLGVSISSAGAEALALSLGRDLYEEKKAGGRVIERKEAYDLWQVHSELSKLASYTSHIEPSDVAELVKPKVPDSVFHLSDSLAGKNRKQAIAALDNYLSTQSGDEKSAFIKIVGLLAEQFRSILLVSTMMDAGLDNQTIADKLGWSSGRVFVVSKNARNFSVETLKQFLARLLAIDLQLKSTDTNPRLSLDQFIVEAS